MASFSTLGIPVSKKISYWNEISSATFARMEVKPSDMRGFDGTLNRERIGPVTLMDVFSSAVRIRHTRSHIAAMSKPSFLLLTPLERDFELSVDGGPRVRVQSGEFCLVDHARPYELSHGDAVRTLCLDVPRNYLEQRIPHVGEAVGRLMRPDNGMSRMLMGLLRNLGAEAQLDAVAALPPQFGQSLLELIVSTYSAYVPPRTARGAKARARLFRAHIESRLADSDLTPAAVSAHFGISERYLRAVLRTDGRSFSAHLLHARLAHCADKLSRSEFAGATITEIAFESGFNNATHFGQAFKQRFGMTPSEYRCKSKP